MSYFEDNYFSRQNLGFAVPGVDNSLVVLGFDGSKMIVVDPETAKGIEPKSLVVITELLSDSEPDFDRGEIVCKCRPLTEGEVSPSGLLNNAGIRVTENNVKFRREARLVGVSGSEAEPELLIELRYRVELREDLLLLVVGEGTAVLGGTWSEGRRISVVPDYSHWRGTASRKYWLRLNHDRDSFELYPFAISSTHHERRPGEGTPPVWDNEFTHCLLMVGHEQTDLREQVRGYVTR